MKAATERAVKLLGGIRPTARALGCLPGSVQYWVRRGRVPAERVIALEEAVESKVTRYELRPDIYPR